MTEDKRELILAIDSSNPVATVSVFDLANITEITDAESIKDLIHEVYKEGLKSHSKELMPMIVKLLREINADIEDVKYVGVVTGPGSFTGIRIGIATAKGLGYSNEVRYSELTSLEALARRANISELVGDNIKVISLIDAKHRNMYYGSYSLKLPENSISVRDFDIINETVLNISEISKQLESDIAKEDAVYIVGDAYNNYEELKDIFKDAFKDSNIEYKVLDYPYSVSSSAIVKFASEYINNDGVIDNMQLKTDKEVLPNYLKKYEAVKLKDRDKK